jgi:dienelactone hydrolase
MRFRRLLALLTVALLATAALSAAAPYARAASLVVRAADLGGRVDTLATWYGYPVTRERAHTVPTRQGDVAAQFYTPDTRTTRTVMLIPGIHAMGIEEPRLIALAGDLAASGVRVMAIALPDLQQYRITPRATDVIEDAIAWVAARPDLAPDGRVGVIGVSFAGGLSIAAAGRAAVRDKVAFIVSFGGHGDTRRVMQYLTMGGAPRVAGLDAHPPHDYGAAIVLYELADRGVVPAAQVRPLREAIATFLHASQLTFVDRNQARASFAAARDMTATLPEPASTYMTYVNDRAVDSLGPVLAPFLDQPDADNPALSAELAAPPAAPVYLLHGIGDTVIPAAESALLAESLRRRGARVRLLLTRVITHAAANRDIAASEAWNLIAFWTSILRESP